MMGPRQVAQGALFYEFSIEDHVPPDRLVRAMDRFVDLGDMRRHLTPFYSTTGRPSVDPELMIRMLIVGYAFGIRSERRLCEEVHLNLAYRWFCRLDLTDPVPDHSTFSKNRHGRFRDSDLFRQRSGTSPEIIAAVRQLVLLASDDQIAGILNRYGLLTGHGKRWIRERVSALRSHHKIPVFRPAPDAIEPWLNLTNAVRLLGVTTKTLRLAAEAGSIEGVHP